MRVLALLLVASTPALAQEPAIHGLEQFGGSPRAKETLLRRGFVVTDETFRQIFSFYIARSRVFVTTDALLHAYFVNVEESVRALEQAQRERLLDLLARLRERLKALRTKGDEPLDRLVEQGKLDATWRDAADAVDAYLLVARTLLSGGEPPEGPVADEIALVLAAKGDAVSPLRGVPLDYARFDPSGAPEPRFHRAMTWLYDVPFRVSDEQETRQAMILAAIREGGDGPSAREFAAVYREFLGPGDDPDIEAYGRIFSSRISSFGMLAKEPERWATARQAIARLPAPRHPTTPSAEAVEDPLRFRGLRYFSRPTLIDNEAFRTLTPFGLDRPPPSGEELMAALGSAAAQSIVREREVRLIVGYDDLLARARTTVATAQEEPSAVLVRAQRAVFRTLLEPPARADLPAYYVHPDWRFKDLNTCLAGWAHHRYIWGTHAKTTISYGGAVHGPRGLIEPNEAFFGALLDLTVVTGACFHRHGVKEHRFDDLAELLAELRLALRAQLEGRPAPEPSVFERFGPRLAGICGFEGNSWLVDRDLDDHTFAVPVARDLLTGQQRWVGQARPRAIYVIADHQGHRFLFVGGVLGYRDHVGPSEGGMTLGAWKERASADSLAAPAWHARFSVAFGEDELLEQLRAGRILPQTLVRPAEGIGDVLADKLARGDPFSFGGILDHRDGDPRSRAIDLFAKSGSPRVVETLFPLLERPPEDRSDLRGWPEAAALAGRLGDEHVDSLLRWAGNAGRGAPLLFAVIATIPGAKAQGIVLDFLDRTERDARGLPSQPPTCPFATVAAAYVRHGGLPAGILLLNRCDRYGETARALLLGMLKRRWPEPAKPHTFYSDPPPAYTDEENAFALALHEKAK